MLLKNNILSAFPEVAVHYSAKIAATDADSSITYHKLLQTSLCLHHSFNQPGFHHSRVAVFMPNGVKALTSIVGTLLSGLCFSSIDPSFPDERNKVICEIGKFDFILTLRDYYNQACVFFSRDRILLYEDLIISKPSSIDDLKDVAPETPAIMFFTSGSTGLPKAAVHTHGRIREGLTDSMSFFNAEISDRFDMIVPLGFTASMFVYFSLLKGSSVHFFDVRKKGIIAYVKFLRKNSITFSIMTVTALRAVAKISMVLGKLHSIRMVSLVGEPVLPSDIVLFKKQFSPRATLIHVYGTTEARFISFNRFEHHDFVPESVSAGLPFGKVKIYILDEQLIPLPAGEIGQVSIHSPYMIHEYFNNEQETRNSFIYHEGLKKILYLTGDLGYLSEDGCLFHKGRNDFMVKVRGNRVDLFEIEKCILSFPGISDCAVVNRGTTFTECLLTAYCVGNTENKVSEIRQYVSLKLPDYMIPAFFIFKEELPLTTTGKTDRKTLIDEPLDYGKLLGEEKGGQIEYDPVYQKIKAIWLEELKLPRLSPAHCFFNDLGGDSVLAVQVLSRIKTDLGIELPYFILFRYRTLGKLVRYIQSGTDQLVGLDMLRKPFNNSSPVLIFVPPVKGGADTYNFALKSYPEKFGLFVLTYNLVDHENKHFYPPGKLMDLAAETIDQYGFNEISLVGYSMGGLLAYEIATRLKTTRLRKVILFDIPPARYKGLNILSLMGQDVRLLLFNLRRKNWKALRFNMIHFSWCVFYLFYTGSRIIRFEKKNNLTMSEAAHLRFYRQFSHRPLQGDMLLIRSTDPHFKRYKYDWGKFVQGEVSVHTIESDHKQLLSPANMKKISERVIKAVSEN